MKFLVDTNRDTITIDGVEISMELLWNLANPDPAKFYRLMRERDVVTVEAFTLETTGPVH